MNKTIILSILLLVISLAFFLHFEKERQQTTVLLIDASGRGDLPTVSLLVFQGACVNCTALDGTTALIEASKNDRLDVVSFLLSHGAEVNIPDVSSLSPLFWSEFEGKSSAAQILVKAGGKMRIPSKISASFTKRIHSFNDPVLEKIADENHSVD